MGYLDEDTIKQSIICVINQLTDKLGIYYEFNDLWQSTYAELEETRNELIEEYNLSIKTKKKNKQGVADGI